MRDRNILLYTLYVVFNEPLFWGPILIVALQQLAGMSLSEIFYMEAVVMCIGIAIDIPSGALADVIGRKKTIILGRLFLFLGICFFATMTSATGAWIGNILWIVGFTLQSGADTSLLYETLKERGREGEYKRIQGRAVGYRFILGALCSLSVGFLAEIDIRLPLILCVPFVCIPFISSFFFRESVGVEIYSARNQAKTLREGIAFVLNSPQVLWMVGFAALIVSTSKIWFFTYNPYFEFVNLPLAQYGVIFFLINVFAWISSHYAYDIERSLGERRCVLIGVWCVAGPILLMALVPIQPFAYLVIIQNVVRGFLRPFFEDYIHHHISQSDSDSTIRATVMSAQSTVTNIVAAAGLAGFGFLNGHVSLVQALLILGSLCLMLGMLSYRTYVQKIMVR